MNNGANLGGSFNLGADLPVHRMGFGAMRLAGPKVFGPPSDPAEAQRVLEGVAAAGINHIDTSDFYGPHVVNQLIRDTLQPFRDDLVIVTKIGARRTPNADWLPALKPNELKDAVDDNLRNLGIDVLDVVNLRVGTGEQKPVHEPIAEQFETMLELQQKGKIRHIGLSNIVVEQLNEALKMGPVVCVQNSYGVLNRTDEELVNVCAAKEIAFVPFFPLGGGFKPLSAARLDEVAGEVGASAHQVALAWLLHRSSNILLIPGTSNVAHLNENIAAASIALSEQQMGKLSARAASA